MNSLYSILSVAIVSLLSFVGIFFLAVNKERLQRILLFLVSFAAGGLLGDAFIHLLPEAVEEAGGFSLSLSIAVLTGLLAFFVLEKIICWRHCHIPTSDEHPHPVALMNLIGDAFHNFLDGLIIAGAYASSLSLGVATTLAVVFHEIPQEIGDFGVLIHGGFSRRKALLLNFGSAALAVLGALVGIFLESRVEGLNSWLIPFTTGGFLYIAGADLIPELKKETGLKKSAPQLAGLLLGIGIMWALTLLE